MAVDGIPGSGPNDVASGEATEFAKRRLSFFSANTRGYRAVRTVLGSEATSETFKIYLERLPAGAVVDRIFLEFDGLVDGAGTATATVGTEDDTDSIISTPIDITSSSVHLVTPPQTATAGARFIVIEVTHTSGAWQANSQVRSRYRTREPQLLTVRNGRGYRPPLSSFGNFPALPLPEDEDLPPEVALSVNSTVTEGNSIALDASGSSDPEGTSLSYLWQVEGATPTGVAISNRTSAVATASTGNYNSNQIVTFKCFVTDGAGNTSSDSRTVTIEADNDPPTGVMLTTNKSTADAGETVELQTAASDPEGNALLYTFVQTVGTSVDVNVQGTSGSTNSTGRANFVAPSLVLGETMTFEVQVSDGTNAAVTDTVNVQIEPDAQPSTGDLQAHSGGTLYCQEGATATIGATFSGGDGSTATYSWEVLTAPQSVTLSSTTAQYPTFTAPSVSSDETYSFRVTVDVGAESSTATTDVVVKNTADFTHTKEEIGFVFNGTPSYKFFWNGDLAVLTGSQIQSTTPATASDSPGPAINGGVVDLVPAVYTSGSDQVVTEVTPNQTEASLYSPNGSTTSFSGASLTLPGTTNQIGAGSVTVTWRKNGQEESATDDGFGNFIASGSLQSGSLIFSTGAVSLTFSSPPDAVDISATYGAFLAGSQVTQTRSQGFSDQYTRDNGASQTVYSDSDNDVLGISSGSPLTLTTGQCLTKVKDALENNGFAPFGGIYSMSRAACVHAVSAETLALIDDQTFRPGPCGDQSGSDRTMHRFRDIDYSPLNNIFAPTITLPTVPADGQYSNTGLFVDINPHFQGTESIPFDEYQDYGEDFCDMFHGMAMMAASNQATMTERRDWLHRIIQVGIDIQSLVDNGMCWSNEGGTPQGRKLPAVIARKFLGLGAPSGGTWEIQGAHSKQYWSKYSPRNQQLITDDTECLNPFGDDWQCGYVKASQVNGQGNNGVNYTTDQIGMPEWDGKGYQRTATDRFSNWDGTGDFLLGQGEDDYRYMAPKMWMAVFLVYLWDMETEWAWKPSLDYYARFSRICDDISWGRLYAEDTFIDHNGYAAYGRQAFWQAGESAISGKNMYWGAPFGNKQAFIDAYPSHFPPNYPAGQGIDFPPIANAGVDQTVVQDTVVTLDGSGSTDDNSITSYEWVQTGGETVVLSNRFVAQPTFTAPTVVSGTKELTFQLTVQDSLNQQATDTVMVTAQQDQPPSANAGADQVVPPSTAGVTLDATGSTDDDGISTYAWTQTGGTAVTLSDSAVAQPTFTAPATEETLIFQLQVTDTAANTDTDSVSIVVAAPAWNGTATAESEFVAATINGSPGFDIEVDGERGIGTTQFTGNSSYIFRTKFKITDLNTFLMFTFDVDNEDGTTPNAYDAYGFYYVTTDGSKLTGVTINDEDFTSGYFDIQNSTSANTTVLDQEKIFEITVNHSGADTNYAVRMWDVGGSRPSAADISGTRSSAVTQTGNVGVYVARQSTGPAAAQVWDMEYSTDGGLSFDPISNTY